MTHSQRRLSLLHAKKNLFLIIAISVTSASAQHRQPTLPALGTPVPPAMRSARVGQRLCATDDAHSEPCATIRIHKAAITVAWNEQTGLVTFLSSKDLITDSELATGGICRLINPSAAIPYLGGFVTAEWRDTAQEISGDAIWTAKLALPSPGTTTPKGYGTIVGFVQSKYLNDKFEASAQKTGEPR